MFKRWLTTPIENTLIIGPRRAGKTTFLKNNFPSYQYVTLDDLDYLTWAKQDAKGLISSLGSQVIVDEIQRHPAVKIAVKFAIDQHKSHFLMTGSSALGLLDSTAETLAGRIDLVHMPAMCWGEEQGPATHRFFHDQVSPLQLAEGRRLFEMQLEFGGFPEVICKEQKQEKEKILKRYRDTYFTRDLAQLSNIENIDGLLAILNHVARSTGSRLEVSNFARESGLSHPTAKKYLNVLLQSDLAFKLYGYNYGPSKRYLKASKIYYADNSLPTSLGLQLSRGQQIEAFAISELEKRRKLGSINSDQFYYYQSKYGSEIDLIFVENNVLHAVEIKATSKPSPKDFRNLKAYISSDHSIPVRGYLIYLGDKYLERDSISCIPLWSLYRAQ